MKELNTAFLISGSGSTAQKVAIMCQNGELEGIKPVVVISSKPEADGLMKAKKLGIKTEVIQQRLFKSREAFGEGLLDLLKENDVDLVAQLGWLPLTPLNVVEKYNKRIFNQHPAPLDPGRPDFGGKGMYGLRAHLAVLLYQQLTGIPLSTEATTHQVNQEYDQGEIIRRVPMSIIRPDRIMNIEEIIGNPAILPQLLKSAEDIQKELLPIEHDNVIVTLRDYAKGKIPVFKREQPLIQENCITFLNEAKKLAIDFLANKELYVGKK